MSSYSIEKHAAQVPTVASHPALIGIDWGSTNLRSFLFDHMGVIVDEMAANQDISQFPQERLAEIFHQLLAK